MVSRLFISYRRDDSAGYAGRLYDRLEREFGRDHLVMDVDAIPLGANFVKVLGDEVAKCDLLLAIIGPGWLEARDEEGNRRLENPQDFVRIEIGTALKRGIPVIPILLEGTRIPKADQLPDDLKELPLRNGLNVRHVSFLDDLERLIRGLKREARRKAEEEAPRKAAEEAEARRKAEEEAQRKAAEEAEARRKAEEEAHRKAAEEARRKAEEEAQRKAAEEARRKAEEEAQRKAAEQAKAQETREWGLVISSRDKKVIQNFLERWPHSQRADAARARIGALEREAAEAEARRKAEEERKLQADAARARIVALERAPGEPGAASQLVQEPADWRTVAKRAVLGTVAIGALVLALLALSWLPARQSSVPGPSQSRPTKPASSESLEPARPDQALSVQPGSGQSLRDRLANGQLCPRCPEMVVVPKGVFTMGSPASEPQRDIDENQLLVSIAEPFAVGKYAVTRGEFAAFVEETGYATSGCITWSGSEWKPQADKSWRAPGFAQDDRHPVVCVSWDDAKAYAAWLSKKTDKTYRLLSEAEREYVARAGTTTPFWWGTSITPSQANYNGNYLYAGGGSKGEYRSRTVPVDSFKANPWGLYNVHGNVWEWTEDCWNESNSGNPGNGSARNTGNCDRRVVRGGSWFNYPELLRAADRGWGTADFRGSGLGFRVARTLTP